MKTPMQAFMAHPVTLISHLLVIVGALVWLAVAVNKDRAIVLINAKADRIIHGLVGLAGVVLALHMLVWIAKSNGLVLPTESFTAATTTVPKKK